MVSSRAMKVPSLRYHKASRQGRVTLGGKTLYCGPWGEGGAIGEPASLECQARYKAHIARWLDGGGDRLVTIARVVTEFMEHARAAYPSGQGGHGGEATNYKYALRCLEWTVQVNGQPVYLPNLEADRFTVIHLEALRERMRLEKYKRKYANRTVKRLIFCFKWAAKQRLVKRDTYLDLTLLELIRRGVPGWEDSAPVRSVPDSSINLVLPHLSDQTRAIVELCRLTGMRIGEVLSIRTGAINTSLEDWIFDLGYGHKTGHLEVSKEVKLNAAAQKILKPWLTTDLNAPVFTHRRSSVRKAIVEACDRLNIPRWTTHRLRHSRGTEVARAKFEALREVKAALGQSSDSSALVYVDPDALTG